MHLGHTWGTAGVCFRVIRGTPGTYLRHIWDTLEVYVGHSWESLGAQLKDTWGTSGYTWSTPGTHLGYIYGCRDQWKCQLQEVTALSVCSSPQ